MSMFRGAPIRVFVARAARRRSALNAQLTAGAEAGKAGRSRNLPAAKPYLLYSVFAQTILRVAAECAEQTFQLIRRLGEPHAVGAAQHEGHTEIAPPKIGIGANFDGSAPSRRPEGDI